MATKDSRAEMPLSTRTAGVDDAAELLPLALATPAQALAEARDVLRSQPGDLVASYAHQAAGIVLRERGDWPEALRELRAAMKSAHKAGLREREIDIRGTLGVALVMAGRSGQGLAELDLAAAMAHGKVLARIRLRRAHVLCLLGRYTEGLVDLQQTLVAVRRSRDTLWEARTLNNRCLVYIAVGALDKAEADATRAEQLYDQVGQTFEAIQAFHNRAIVATRRGDIPAALRILDLAEARYGALGFVEPDLIVDRGRALLAAGLASEAVDAAEGALSQLTTRPTKRAELLFFAARAALAAELPEQARRWADAAIRLFRAQQRQSWESRALLLATQARYVCGDRSARLLARIVDLAPQLAELHAEEAPLAYLLAGRLALECRRHELATENLMAAMAYRHNGPPLTRATGWLAVAMHAASADRQRGLLLACRRGLDALDEHRFIFGAAEIRAMATSHGRDLAALAIDAVARKGSPRSMLEWAERWRATSLAEPSVRATNDSELEPELAALRDAARRLEEVSEAGTRSALLEEQRLRREAAIRRRRMQISGSLGPPPGFDVDELLSSLGPARLVVLIEANGVLNALVAGGGQVRRHEVGPVAAATHEVAFARFALRRAAHARDARTAAIAESLQRVLLGPVARLIDDEPVIVVPPARLHLTPWALLPALAGRPVSVAPSALMWLRARTTAANPRDEYRVSLIVGPQLGTAGAEVTSLATLYPSATVVGAESSANCFATIDSVLDSMSGAWIAHIAAHGVFRGDSPLYSSLKLDEGPLFVHDLDRLSRPPHRVVLSACDSGVAAPVGADELLGMVSALLRIGAAGVLASVVPVNDVAVVPFMVAVHSALAKGKDMPEAALEGRQVASSEAQAAAAASFNVWGS